MDYVSTGQAATLLATTEPRLNDLIRRGKIAPLPELAHGRRRWAQPDLERAASALGVECPDLAQREAQEVGRD